MNGYYGRLLIVDLGAGRVHDEPLPADLASTCVGGSGLATRLLYDAIDVDTEPLGSSNPLIVMCGPLTGTRAPMCGRHAMVARSPLTGLLGEAHVGGFFGAELRHAGYDGLVITGCSAEPVWLSIRADGAELREAGDLWGLDTQETQARIRAELADARVRVGSIGPAGESRVRYAAVAHDNSRMAGRTGMGAVMGSKRLKAIAVRAARHDPPPMADAAHFTALARQARDGFKDDVGAQILRTSGTGGNVDYMYYLGALPIRYFTQGEWEGVAAISGNTMAETILTGVEACYGCPIACGRRVTVTEGQYPTDGEIKGPEYETLGAFGSQLLIDDLAAVTRLGHLCDRYGMDSISAGNTIALATYLYQEGVLTAADTDGLELAWGDPEMAIDLVGRIARREGFGEVLGEGSRRLAQHFGVEDVGVHINGMSPAMHDPRGYSGMALVYATSPIGASHNQSDYYWVENGRVLEELDIYSPGVHQDAGKAPHVVRHQDWNAFVNALVTCSFSSTPPSTTVEILNAATGRDLTPANALEIGERLVCLKRALNIRLGYTTEGERLPRLMRRALTDGGSEGFVPDEALLLREYYAARDWDPRSGRPTMEKLAALGLDELVQDLWHE